ncbi:hypothetical protein ACHAWF_006824, partial [Thalassiosira exigua]
LADQVPTFGTGEAWEIIKAELESKIEDVFANFPGDPIVAASLGQVYQAMVQGDGGTEAEERVVAVKVQRPNILNHIALDMHLIREVTPIVKRTFNLNTDFVGVVHVSASAEIRFNVQYPARGFQSNASPLDQNHYDATNLIPGESASSTSWTLLRRPSTPSPLRRASPGRPWPAWSSLPPWWMISQPANDGLGRGRAARSIDEG